MNDEFTFFTTVLDNCVSATEFVALSYYDCRKKWRVKQLLLQMKKQTDSNRKTRQFSEVRKNIEYATSDPNAKHVIRF